MFSCCAASVENTRVMTDCLAAVQPVLKIQQRAVETPSTFILHYHSHRQCSISTEGPLMLRSPDAAPVSTLITFSPNLPFHLPLFV
jgi:hypothetical protein